jgi:ribosomal protein L11 methyltransferase
VQETRGGKTEEAISLTFYENVLQLHQLFILLLEFCGIIFMKNDYQIDWDAQWALHGRNFRQGCVHILFHELGLEKTASWKKEEIVLLPGPGFGDFSHPTTELVLSMMAPFVPSETVLDIGCGSGVLSIAAHAFGAARCFGVDIDTAAVEHAKKNAFKNSCKETCHFILPQKIYPHCSILLLNMISSEQEVVMRDQAIKKLQTKALKHIFTSGILCEEEAHYKALTDSWGWKEVARTEKSGWLGFHFTLI